MTNPRNSKFKAELRARKEIDKAKISVVYKQQPIKEMIDEKTAAWRLAQELRQWQEFGRLEKAISTATNQLSLLYATLEQQKQAIATLVHLQKMGMTEAEIGQWVKLVGDKISYKA